MNGLMMEMCQMYLSAVNDIHCLTSFNFEQGR